MKVSIPHRRLGSHVMEIDDEDFDKIKDLNLTLNHTSNPNTKYVKSIVYENCKYIKSLHVHRIIMGLGDFKKDKRMVNHIDGNGLNNKKCNLEMSNAMHNSQSFRKPNLNATNIYFENAPNRKKKWRFDYVVNKKRHRKRFETEEEAIQHKKVFLEKLVSSQ